MRVINERTQSVIVQHLEWASSFYSRLMGLMFRRGFESGHGLWFKRSGNSIHTCFMRFAIDVVFVTKKGEIKYAAQKVKPWRLVIAPLLVSTDCLELPAGTLERSGTKVGDYLRVEA